MGAVPHPAEERPPSATKAAVESRAGQGSTTYESADSVRIAPVATRPRQRHGMAGGSATPGSRIPDWCIDLAAKLHDLEGSDV